MNFISYAATSLAAISGAMLAFLAVPKLADEVFGGGPTAQRLALAAKNFDLKPSFSKAYVAATYWSDSVYGPRLLSWRALFVSVGVSLSWLAVLAIAALCTYGKHAWLLNPVFAGAVATQFWYFFGIGLVIDFISVCMTRALLLFAVDKGSLVKALVLVLDLVGSAVLFYTLYGLAKYAVYGDGSQTFSAIGFARSLSNWFDSLYNLQLISQFIHDATFIPDGMGNVQILNGEAEIVYAFPEGMIFCASLLTTLWIAVHIAAYWFLQGASKISAAAQALIKESSLTARPFLSISTIACVLVLVPCWLVSLAFWLCLR